ncbi:unnamed protein product [Medioppia subpectinata]|uniref:Uncharacterized protein n=1 Tax=Medioppia subpectinata TaxID=1979941 RepID=A0A7R9KE78_9ACAR|nr:unnamed protein product [Medioppia subpectinata]CAG2101711.1 unnamed protein product [Medioppia subpectinata]
MNVLLVLLLISLVIVIVIALIVAFVKHRNNESKTKPVTDKTDKNIASDPKNAQKPSTTSAKANPEVQSPTTTEPNIQTPSKLEAEVPKPAKSDSIESKRSLNENYMFCDIQDTKFQSIFNLGNDLIIQTKTEFLKLKDSIDSDEDLEKYFSRSPRFVIDTDLWTDLQSLFDLSKPVFGFTYQFMSNDCGNLDVLNECTEVYDDPQIFYTCLYGTNKTGGSLTWLARKYNNSLLMTIDTPVLESRVKTYCGFKWKHNDTNLAKEGFFSGVSFRLPHPEILLVDMNAINTTSSGLPVNPINGTVDDNSTRVLVPFYEDKITFQIFTAESLAFPNTVNLLGYQFCKLLTTTAPEYWYPFMRIRSRFRSLRLSRWHFQTLLTYWAINDVYYVFRYLNQTWSCGQNCGPNTPLSLIDLSNNLTTTLTTLRSLFGCEQYHYESYSSFKPNDFCGTDQRLESVFGLGNDLYFQNNAKFWKWSDVSFKSGANPGIKSEPIFFDSDFTTILNKFHIDTTKPVMGFTFKLYSSSSSNVNECLTNADTIRCQLHLNPDYYRACIYGEVIDNTNKTIGKLKDSFERKAFAFQYTPSGLKAFPVVGHSDSKTSHLNSSHSIASIVKCDFNQSYKYTEERHLDVCETTAKQLKSVFNIGKHVYIQSGRKLFRFRPKNERNSLYFDRYVTDLLNDYFDINHRIIGYSYLLNNKTYRTIIIGRSNWKTSKQFNSQSIYGVFDSKTGPLNRMIPNNKGSNDLPFSVHTIDSFDKQYLQNNITSDTILAIAYLQTTKSVDQYTDGFLNPQSYSFDEFFKCPKPSTSVSTAGMIFE